MNYSISLKHQGTGHATRRIFTFFTGYEARASTIHRPDRTAAEGTAWGRNTRFQT